MVPTPVYIFPLHKLSYILLLIHRCFAVPKPDYPCYPCYPCMVSIALLVIDDERVYKRLKQLHAIMPLDDRRWKVWLARLPV